MNTSEELLNNITEYKKEKNISGPFDVCWQCKETNLSEDLRGINCDHKYHHHIIICLCKKCKNIQKNNIEDDNWVEELSKTCSENKIDMSKDTIRKSYLKFYKKKYLYHYFEFDYNNTFKHFTINTICNECINEFVKNNICSVCELPLNTYDENIFNDNKQDIINKFKKYLINDGHDNIYNLIIVLIMNSFYILTNEMYDSNLPLLWGYEFAKLNNNTITLFDEWIEEPFSKSKIEKVINL